MTRLGSRTVTDVIGIPRETRPRERRVAATPDVVKKLVQRGHAVVVEAGAGIAAGFADEAYVEAGATIGDAWAAARVLKVEPPTVEECGKLREGATLVSFLWPVRNPEVIQALAGRKATVLAMDKVPRTTIAQKCDALSSMANLSGYRAVIEGAAALQRPLGAQFTAAGKTPPTKVLIIGAGVAGLAAIGAAKALGATVRAFDTRRAAADEVRSLGAEFLELKFDESGEGQGGYAKVMSPEFIAAEMALFQAQAAEVDIVVTTALVPGTKAPTLWTKAHVEAMRPGSVVVDLAAHQGGNCELTKADEVVVHRGVSVLGPTDLASKMAASASSFYAMNLWNLVDEWGEGPTPAHPILGPMLVLVAGEPAPPPVVQAVAPAPTAPKPVAPVAPVAAAPAPARPARPSHGKGHGHAAPPAPPMSRLRRWIFWGIGVAIIATWAYLRYATGKNAVDPQIERFVDQLTVFVLACFVGWQVIWNVSPALHTPLMSVTNAISGIILIGGLLEGGRDAPFDARMLLGLAAILLAMINVAGGFLVTQRMLKMFRK
ncbi:MAG: Re/Si-specific NAD(P)(+) transhydrogenase subunit alpha [Deltaproteobacteria bacterium]|nr:Re/Si-specific NAD(P)(+) transhydrogenase subunit alpha [Deltaproteobacteria bacterium]